MKVSAFYIAEHIDLKGFKESYAGQILQETPSELFYSVDGTGYLYVFDYGAVVFANLSDMDESKCIALLMKHSRNLLKEKLRDDFEIIHSAEKALAFGFDSLTVPHFSDDVAKIAMLNLAHSVSLDYALQMANQILTNVNKFTDQMEKDGDISISRKNMLRFIGTTLNNKNRVIGNLFIFDSPDLTWDDEYLDKIYKGLARTFDIQTRFRESEYTFKVIDDNLSVFRELLLHRESSKLEWIIIILICIEVIDLIISKVLKIL